jgi:aldehyde dehydrogenase (NAD+)
MTSNEQYLKYLPPKEELCHFINNEFVRNVENPEETFDVIAPHNEQLICKVSSGTSKEVDLAVKAAEDAFKNGSEWRRMTIAQRRALFLKLVQRWEEEADELAILESFTNGSPINLSKFIIHDLTNEWLYAVGWMDKLAGRMAPDPNNNDDRLTLVKREPIGVCGIIVPWNVPLWTLVVKIAPALAMGNTVVVKPSEFSPLTALKVAKMMKEVGFPKGVFNIVQGYGINVGDPLARHPRVRKIAFTGSTRTGRSILKCAAESNLKQVQLELGGKSPVIVFPDVNVSEAVKICHFALFNNNGQLCTAGSRTFVHEDIYDQFVAEAVKQAKLMKVGSQMEPSNNVGPLINKVQFEKVLDYIRTGIKEGGKMHCGSPDPAQKQGYFVQPTIFTDLPFSSSKLACEEIFGPVMTIFKFKDLEEVIEMANATDYGLASGILTKDVRIANTVANRLEAGTVWINHYHGAMCTAEFGGYKMSGFGREGGEEGVLGWTQSKSIFFDMANRNI